MQTQRSVPTRTSPTPAAPQRAEAPTGTSNGWLLESLGLADPATVAQDPRVTSEDVMYEQMAHRMIYQGALRDADRALLTEWGFDPDWTFVAGKEGLEMALIRPAPGSDRLPVIVFRGTEPTQREDLAADLGPEIGSTQFEANRGAISDLFAAAGRCDVTGHSLGASLAQIAASEFPRSVRKVVGFQAPGVSQERADRFAALEERPEARYHLAANDLVDLGGEAHLPGSFLVHQPRALAPALDAHVGYLLLSPQYREAREAAGLTEDRMTELDYDNRDMFGVAHHFDKMREVHAAKSYDRYHRGAAKDVVEHIRQQLGSTILDGAAGQKPWWSLDPGR